MRSSSLGGRPSISWWGGSPLSLRCSHVNGRASGRSSLEVPVALPARADRMFSRTARAELAPSSACSLSLSSSSSPGPSPAHNSKSRAPGQLRLRRGAGACAAEALMGASSHLVLPSAVALCYFSSCCPFAAGPCSHSPSSCSPGILGNCIAHPWTKGLHGGNHHASARPREDLLSSMKTLYPA